MNRVGAPPVALPRSHSWAAQAKRIILHDKFVLVWLAILILEIATIGASYALGLKPNEIVLEHRLSPPIFTDSQSSNLLGADSLGRDVAIRMLIGTRVSLAVGLGGALGAAVIGVLTGLTAGYFGRRVDDILMRLVDVQLSFPPILLALAVVSILGGSLLNLIIVLTITGWVGMARVVRGQVLALREFQYVEAARSIGASAPRIMLRHILPNAMAPIIVLFTFSAASNVVVEATLSFLGLGMPPSVPSWGTMMAEGREFMRDAWWITVFPGLLLMVTVLSINMLGDWLRDYLDPTLRQR